VRDIRCTLDGLPKGIRQLDKAYDQTIAQIKSQGDGDVCLAQRVFGWITNARRPLSAAELQAAPAVEVSNTEFDKENIVRMDELLAVCAGLVFVEQVSSKIHLIHFTTEEYIQHAGAEWVANASECIALTCLTYVSLRNVAGEPCKNIAELESRWADHIFLKYAASTWGCHSHDSQDKVRELVAKKLQNVALVRSLNQLRLEPYRSLI
jgi:hypothetical protein